MDKELGVVDSIFSQSGNCDFGWPVTKLKPPAIILLQAPQKCIGTGWGSPKIQTRTRYHGQGIGGCRFHFFTKWEWWFWVACNKIEAPSHNFVTDPPQMHRNWLREPKNSNTKTLSWTRNWGLQISFFHKVGMVILGGLYQNWNHKQ